MPPKAVILSSGGLDSTTVLAMARERGFALYSITFDYGQRHRFELGAAERIAGAMGVECRVLVKFDLRSFGGSALTDRIDVPKDTPHERIGEQIPITYVPARNTVFLSLALGWAETLGAYDIFIGVNALDYSGYPDCRPEFIEAFERTANLATRAGVEGRGRFRVHTPLIRMTKSEIIREGTRLGVDFGLTHSCYDPSADGVACGRCDACLLRRRGFEQAGLPDPIAYQA